MDSGEERRTRDAGESISRKEVLGESVARFHPHFGERENENVNGEVRRVEQKKKRNRAGNNALKFPIRARSTLRASLPTILWIKALCAFKFLC